jgi:hypothetical protein
MKQDRKIIKNRLMLVLMGGVSILSGCASTNIPEVPDGKSGPITVAAKYDHVRIDSQWRGGMPLGPGKYVWYIHYPTGPKIFSSCTATFLTPLPPKPVRVWKDMYGDTERAYSVWQRLYGSGEISGEDGKINYRGELSIELKTGEGCRPNGRGEFIRSDGWKLEGRFYAEGNGRNYVEMHQFSPTSEVFTPRSLSDSVYFSRRVLLEKMSSDDACKIVDPENKVRWSGYCEQYIKTKDGKLAMSFANQNSALDMATGSGSLWTGNGDRIDLILHIGKPVDGQAKLTQSDGTVWKVLYHNAQIVARHLAPESITSKAIKGCSSWQGFTAVEGRCTAGRWNGAVQAYSADSERRISGQFANGTPQGDIEYSELSTGVRIRGHAATGGGAFGFTQGRLYQAGVMTYDGLFSGVQPNGRGTCVYQGAPESCEYYNGARVDALYKTRQDNERTRLAQEKARQQQEQARQQQAQAQARQSKDSNWGLKAMVIGGVAAIAGNSGIAIDKQVEIVSNVATDVLSDGKTSNTSNMLSNQQQEVINKSSASAASDKKPASVSNIAASNRGQINSVAKACNRQVGAIVSLNSKQQYTEAAEACKTVAPQGFVWGTDSGEGNGSAEGSCKKAVHEAYDGKYAKTACYCYQDHNPAAYSALSPGSWICWVGEGG